MVCFDYEEVVCVICDECRMDGYVELNGKIVCDECLELLNKNQQGG